MPVPSSMASNSAAAGRDVLVYRQTHDAATESSATNERECTVLVVWQWLRHGLEPPAKLSNPRRQDRSTGWSLTFQSPGKSLTRFGTGIHPFPAIGNIVRRCDVCLASPLKSSAMIESAPSTVHMIFRASSSHPTPRPIYLRRCFKPPPAL